MSNENMVSHRDLNQLLKSESYREYYELKEERRTRSHSHFQTAG